MEVRFEANFEAYVRPIFRLKPDFCEQRFEKFVHRTARGDIPVDLSSMEWVGLTDTWRLGEQPFSMRDPKTFYTVVRIQVRFSGPVNSLRQH